jgi:hypothetical protein
MKSGNAPKDCVINWGIVFGESWQAVSRSLRNTALRQEETGSAECEECASETPANAPSSHHYLVEHDSPSTDIDELKDYH